MQSRACLNKISERNEEIIQRTVMKPFPIVLACPGSSPEKMADWKRRNAKLNVLTYQQSRLWTDDGGMQNRLEF
jgi:hypothetical protein